MKIVFFLPISAGHFCANWYVSAYLKLSKASSLNEYEFEMVSGGFDFTNSLASSQLVNILPFQKKIIIKK